MDNEDQAETILTVARALLDQAKEVNRKLDRVIDILEEIQDDDEDEDD